MMLPVADVVMAAVGAIFTVLFAVSVHGGKAWLSSINGQLGSIDKHIAQLTKRIEGLTEFRASTQEKCKFHERMLNELDTKMSAVRSKLNDIDKRVSTYGGSER